MKTQHAGPETHIAVCRVLEYVKNRYAPNLEIHDDSGYFFHRDVEALKAAMAMTNAILDRVRAAFGAPAGASAPRHARSRHSLAAFTRYDHVQ